MAIFNLSGASINAAYNVSGAATGNAFDINGAIVFPDSVPWGDEITITTARESATNSLYYFVRIPQIRSDGSRQYPFVVCPDGTGAATKSALSYALATSYYAVINGGVFHPSTDKIDGITIVNSTVILNTPTTEHSNPVPARPLTIDNTGVLSYTEYNADGYTLVLNGVVSCISGFMPIVVNGVAMTDWINLWGSGWYNSDAQRQIIGQFYNGDYAIVTVEGRNYANSPGISVHQAASLCISLGINFAYLLDGGGSTETVIENTQLNTIYEGSAGRKVPSFIVFNGTDSFN